MTRVVVRDSVAYGGPGDAAAGRRAWNGRGGAVAVMSANARASFRDCAFVSNEAWGGAAGDGGASSSSSDYLSNLGEGGGVYVSGGTASFVDCVFEGNVAEKEVRSVHWFPYDRVGVVNADP